MEAKVFAYHYVVSTAKAELMARGGVMMEGGGRVNTPVPPPKSAGGTLEADGGATRAAPVAGGPSIMHAREDMFLRAADGTPLECRLIIGCGGHRVPWGIIQEMTEVDDGEVQVWTATAGTYAGQAAGVAILNPRVSVSITALFLKGNGPPRKGSIFRYRRDDGTEARMICLKITRHWHNESYLALQVEGCQWDSPMTLASP